MKHCPNCSLDLPTTSVFCKHCGGELLDAEGATVPNAPSCPSCGAEVRTEGEVCADCNYKLASAPTSTTPTDLLRICSSCGTDNSMDALFCRECGENLDPLQKAGQAESDKPAPPQPASPSYIQSMPQPDTIDSAQALPCSNCGSWNRPGLRFCETCGKPLDPTDTQARGKRKSKRLIYAASGSFALLAILFLGWFLMGVSVTVISNPPGSTVFIDRQEIGQTSLSDGQKHIARLGRGQHSLRVERQGYTTFNQTFDLGVLDFSKTIDAKLDPSVFTLTIITDPAGCSVSLDSAERGMTNDTNGELVLADVSGGTHSLTLSRPGYQAWTREISLESSQVVRANLTPLAEETVQGSDQSNSSTSQSEIESTLQAWARSLSNKDLDGSMRYYAEHLDTFLTRSNVSRDQVRATRMTLFSRYSSINIQLSNFHVNIDPSGSSAIVTIDTKYDFRSTKSLTGSAQNEIRLEKRGSNWLITNEKHIQTYYETSQ